MTTVVLTPTHMASDHCVVRSTFPHDVNVSLDNKKIFIAPHKKYMIGLTGHYRQSEIDTPETWDAMGIILAYILSAMADNGLDSGGVFLDELTVPLAHYKNVFDPAGKTLLVTKRHRFAISAKKGRDYYAKELGDFAGVGTGGMYAAGLCMGGVKIHDIWEPLHRYDHLSSVEHTVVPLSILKATTQLDKTMRIVRDKALGREGEKP